MRFRLIQDYFNPVNLGAYSKGYEFDGKITKDKDYISRITRTNRYANDAEAQKYIEYFDVNICEEV